MYGQFDFMNSEAGEKLVKLLNENKVGAKYYEISEGGHNLYIDNPFDTNQKIFEIVLQDATKANNNDQKSFIYLNYRLVQNFYANIEMLLEIYKGIDIGSQLEVQ